MAEENVETIDRDDVETVDGQPEDEPEGDPEHDDHEDPETFPRDYVEKLRRESKGYRERAKDAETRVDELSRELFRFKVERNGKLADPEDLEYDPDLLADDGALDAAVDELITKRPHYGKRKVGGGVGQGVTGDKEQPFSLMGRLSQSV